MRPLRLSTPNIDEDAVTKVAGVLRSGNLVYGTVGQEFEQELARFVGTSEAVVVSSGTAALYLALRGLGIGIGDKVLVPDFSFPATANAVVMAGAQPIFVDVDPSTYCMTPLGAEAALNACPENDRPSAILLVHEFGTPCEMPAFRRLAEHYNLKLIEDAACALGAREADGMIGAGSDVACFSFHPRKTLTTGEGGAILTNNAELAARVRVLRNHGIERTNGAPVFHEPALNFRLTDVQSALGLSQLPKLSSWIQARRELAHRYFDTLAPLAKRGDLTLPGKVAGQSWQTFMIVLDERFDRIAVSSAMAARGIETNAGAQCLSGTPAHATHLAIRSSISHRLAAFGLALPMCELMTDVDIEFVVVNLTETLNEFT